MRTVKSDNSVIDTTITSLSEELPKEVLRVRVMVMPLANPFPKVVMQAALDRADKAIAAHSVSGMISSLEELKEFM
jgi:hypothetical protein